MPKANERPRLKPDEGFLLSIGHKANEVAAMKKRAKQIAVEEQMALLNYKHAAVLHMRFGLGNGRPATLFEVGAIFNYTRERVRQIELNALKKLHGLRCERSLMVAIFGEDSEAAS